MADNRLHWVDVAKGILILLVVLGHFSGISKTLGIDHSGVRDVGGLNFLFTSFYMAAFFVLTGYTSNFQKNFSVFFVSSFRSLLVPAFSFSVIYLFLLAFLFKDGSYIRSLTGFEYWYSGFKFYWFLNALFLSRICYWWLFHYVPSDATKGGLLYVLMIIGLYLSSLYRDAPGSPISHNPFFVHHFMRMAFFLWIGQMFRKHESQISSNNLLVWGVIFVCTSVLLKAFGIRIPTANYTTNFDFTILEVLKYMFFTISGSGIIIYVAKRLGRNSLLEYFGRNSLVVYVTHFCIIRYVYFYTKPMLQFSDSRIWGCFYSLCVVILTYVICYYTINMMSKRPFSWLLGK